MAEIEELKSRLCIYQIKANQAFKSLQEELDDYYPETNDDYLKIVSDLIGIINSIELCRIKLKQEV